MAAIEYKLDDAEWATGDHALIDGDGVHTLQYRARDVAGNVGDAGSATVAVDVSAPSVSVTGADDAWHRQPVTLLLTANDLASGVLSLAYRVDGGDWVVAASSVAMVTVDAPCRGANDGSHLVEYTATDSVGHESAVQSVFVNIDTSRPQTTAPWPVTVKRGHVAIIPYRVSDSGSPMARVTVRVMRGRCKRTLASWSFTAPSDGRLRYTSFTCNLARGKYRYAILATDEAGNREVYGDWKWLRVQ